MFRIVSHQFGYPMFAANNTLGWSDVESEAFIYDHRDNQDIKLSYWKAMASLKGLDPDSVKVETIQ